jgi:hypothetical protein
MSDIFRVENGQRIIVATTPRFPDQINNNIPWTIGPNNPFMARFRARKNYIHKLLYPYRWLNREGYNHQENMAYGLHNAEAFYPQNDRLAWYGINPLINYSDSSWPWDRAIHQYPQNEFHPVWVLGDMLGELSSGTGATNERVTLAMFLISNAQFRERILQLINLHAETPIIPEVRENGQIHIIKLWMKRDLETLMKSMWTQNEHEQESVLLPRIWEISYDWKSKSIILWNLFSGFNLWNLDAVYDVAYQWNEQHKSVGWHMEVQVDYANIANSKLVITSIK